MDYALTTGVMRPSSDAPVRRLRTAFLWRLLQAVLPLGMRLNPLMRRCYGSDGLLQVPWGGLRLTISGTWLRVASSAAAPIYQTPRRQNPEFFDFLAPLFKTLPDGRIVDVGANIGTYTLAFRQHTEAPIIAFEPDPLCCALLSQNVRDNGLPSVTVKNVACGDGGKTLSFKSGINGAIAAEDDYAAIAVPAVRLDDELLGVAVALIKVDCEGYEWHVLNGCRGTIAVKRPVLFIELHPKLIGLYSHSLLDVCDILRPYYKLAFWDVSPSRRSRSRLVRFFGRYRHAVVKLAGEAQMLALAAADPTPDQIFMLALPRDRVSGAAGA